MLPDVDEPLSVEVFPSEPDRWIAVVEAPAGPFSTRAGSPAEVDAEVRRCITEVLGGDVSFMLVDDLGGAAMHLAFRAVVRGAAA